MAKLPPVSIGVRVLPQMHSLRATPFSRNDLDSPTMDKNSQRPKRRDGALSSLNVAIEGLNLAKEVAGIAPAKAAFGSVSILLTMVRVCLVQFCGDGPRVHVYPGFDDERT